MNLQKLIKALLCLPMGISLGYAQDQMPDENIFVNGPFAQMPLEKPSEEVLANMAEGEGNVLKESPGLIIDGVIDAPMSDYEKYAEQPLLQLYNSATGHLMLFTSMQSFTAFADRSGMVDVQIMVEDAYDKEQAQKLQLLASKGKVVASAKRDIAPSGFDRDETAYFMDFPYLRYICVPTAAGGSVVGGRTCSFASPIRASRDANFNGVWYRPAPSGDNDDSFAVTATPTGRNGQAGTTFENHVYFLQLPPGLPTAVSQACEVYNLFGCWERWGDQRVRSVSLGKYADVRLISDFVPKQVIRDHITGGAVLVNFEIPPSEVFIKSPYFWHLCSIMTRCRTAFRIPDPRTRGMTSFPLGYFNLIPDVRIVFPTVRGNRQPEVANVRVTSYGRGYEPGVNNGEASPGNRGDVDYVRRYSAGMAALAEAFSGCNTSVITHTTPGGSPAVPPDINYCPVPTQIDLMTGQASPMASVMTRSGQRASIFYFYSPSLSSGLEAIGRPQAVSGFGIDCSTASMIGDGVRRLYCDIDCSTTSLASLLPEQRMYCVSTGSNVRVTNAQVLANPCRLNNVLSRQPDPANPGGFNVVWRSDVIPPVALVFDANGAADSGIQLGSVPSYARNSGFDRCASLYGLNIPPANDVPVGVPVRP